MIPAAFFTMRKYSNTVYRRPACVCLLFQDIRIRICYGREHRMTEVTFPKPSCFMFTRECSLLTHQTARYSNPDRTGNTIAFLHHSLFPAEPAALDEACPDRDLPDRYTLCRGRSMPSSDPFRYRRYEIRGKPGFFDDLLFCQMMII
jgi:hypothetical protein